MIKLNGEDLTIRQLVDVARAGDHVDPLDPPALEKMEASAAMVKRALSADAPPVYGVTTGFGPLAQVRIEPDQARRLTRNVVLSSMVGVGDPLAEDIVRAMMLIRVNTFAKGFSGVRPIIAETLGNMLNAGVTPYVPGKGSLGASGDLAPLAHIAAVLSRGEDSERNEFSGQAWYEGELLTGSEAMKRAGFERIVLEPKEGLGLTNGTNFMVAAGALGIHDSQNLLRHAELAAAMSFEALAGTTAALDERLHLANGQQGQVQTARTLRRYLSGSKLADSLPDLVQDAYSLRCTPQVLGPIRDLLEFLSERVSAALNAATDNPLFFGEGEAISGGNFHGQGPSLWLDTLSISVAQMGTISERRTFRMTTPGLNNGLPSMLVGSYGVNSGMMMPQYTAAALVSDNKTLAHPDSVDSVPSSANQEDHVSMGANAARHMMEIIDNVKYILAIELLTAAQGIDLRENGPGRLGASTTAAHSEIRKVVEFLENDRPLAPDIESLSSLISSGKLIAAVKGGSGEET
jgi:histidine ammonia-lyase